MCVIFSFVEGKILALPQFANKTSTNKYIQSVRRVRYVPGKGWKMTVGSKKLIVPTGQVSVDLIMGGATTGTADLDKVYVSDTPDPKAQKVEFSFEGYSAAKLTSSLFDIVPVDPEKPEGAFKVTEDLPLWESKPEVSAPAGSGSEGEATAGSGSEGDQKTSASVNSGSTCH